MLLTESSGCGVGIGYRATIINGNGYSFNRQNTRYLSHEELKPAYYVEIVGTARLVLPWLPEAVI